MIAIIRYLRIRRIWIADIPRYWKFKVKIARNNLINLTNIVLHFIIILNIKFLNGLSNVLIRYFRICFIYL